MGIRRCIAILVLLVAGGAGLGAARAPEDRTLTLSGPERAVPGRTAVFTLQVDGGTPEVTVALTLPVGVSYESDGPGAIRTGEGGGRNSGPCAVDDQVVTCSVDHPEDGLFGWTATLLVSTADPFTLTATTGDLTKTLQVLPVRGADLAVAVENPPSGPITPGSTWTYDVVVRNLGPDPISEFTLHEWFDGNWYRGGTVDFEGAQCTPDPGQLACIVQHELPAGGEVRLPHSMPTLANDRTFGRSGKVELDVVDIPASIDPSNDKVTFPVRFAAKPSTPTATPATPAAPGDGGGLPITGPAGMPLALGGLAFVLAGFAALWLTRRRFARP
ncbi:hypothetical protein KOI35_09935 [Actinoplanes bogorensis]|uniref:DUF11 domain-containing protein n=1 Tax=Paractinoplanes bogorensis TaxID=1610840 RepID=A0ABS5YK69_9ACTN|nr:hypothetical protein [Actinoplanes bogorensis]MBU2663827.1 hypothetical protein [Actinoplanes bogorensis]